MSKVTASVDFDRVKPEDMPKYLVKFGDNVTAVLTNGLSFQDNVDCKLLSATFSASNTDTTVAHGLGRVPVGYLVYSRSASMIVYDGSIANTASNITLRASAAGTIGVIVF